MRPAAFAVGALAAARDCGAGSCAPLIFAPGSVPLGSVPSGWTGLVFTVSGATGATVLCSSAGVGAGGAAALSLSMGAWESIGETTAGGLSSACGKSRDCLVPLSRAVGDGAGGLLRIAAS